MFLLSFLLRTSYPGQIRLTASSLRPDLNLFPLPLTYQLFYSALNAPGQSSLPRSRSSYIL